MIFKLLCDWKVIVGAICCLISITTVVSVWVEERKESSAAMKQSTKGEGQEQ